MLPESVIDSRRYFHDSKDGNTEFIFARSTNLPNLLFQEVVDVGITGEDYVKESGIELIELLDLDLCSGKVCILTPSDSSIKSPSDLKGLVIATQLPNIAKKWIKEAGLETTKILLMDGACEVFPHLSLAHATLDVVSTGDTARANNLLPLLEILYTSGRMYCKQSVYEKYAEEIENIISSLRKKYLKLKS